MQIHRDGLRPIVVTAEKLSRAEDLLVAAFPQREQEAREAFNRGDVVDASAARISPDTMINAGELLYVFRPIFDEPPVPITPVILAQGRGWIAIDKPPMMATMPRGSHVASSATIVVRRFLNNPEVVAAHRLDAATRGVLLFVTDPALRGAYQRLFQSRLVRKRYLAVAPYEADSLASRTGVLRRRLERRRGELRTLVVEGEPNSETKIRLLEHEGDRGLYEVEPLTGKTHQIRAVFADAGMPIEGDWLYPNVGREDTGQLQLLAQSMEFRDPLSCEDVRIVSRQHLDWP